METTDYILPGTLCADISPEQMSAIELGIHLGKKVQDDFPEIGNLYKEGATLSVLVSKFSLLTYFGVKFKVAESAVHRALSGYDGHLRNIDIEPYSGLLSKKELISFGKEHNRVSGIEIGKTMFKEKRGIFAFTEDQRAEARRKSVFACGNVPYSQAELDFIEELATNPQYQKGTLVKVSKIAHEVNLVFHAGKKVRKPRSISKIRLRKKGNSPPQTMK